MSLQPGDTAPPVSLQTDSGAPFRLEDLRGRRVVLYFYPKADTPGCTTQACAFRDKSAAYGSKKAAVVGVSPDNVAAIAKFKKKYGLDFTLLADPDHAVAEAYDVWKEKSMYGRKYMGIERTTFVIDAKGKVERVFPKVKPAGHAEEVLAVL